MATDTTLYAIATFDGEELATLAELVSYARDDQRSIEFMGSTGHTCGRAYPSGRVEMYPIGQDGFPLSPNREACGGR